MSERDVKFVTSSIFGVRRSNQLSYEATDVEMHVRDVHVNINCIVVIHSYGLWINRLLYQYAVTKLVIVVVTVIGDVFSPNNLQIY